MACILRLHRSWLCPISPYVFDRCIKHRIIPRPEAPDLNSYFSSHFTRANVIYRRWIRVPWCSRKIWDGTNPLVTITLLHLHQ